MKMTYHQHCDGGLAPREQTVQAGDLRWRYLEWGTRGQPIALWHGITSSAEGWWRLGPFLASLGFHVFAPDLPGHGLSGDAPDYQITTTARLLDAWMAALGLVSPVVLGHSWGGMNALVQATLADAQVRPRALVLEDPAVVLPHDPERVLPTYTAGLGTPANETSRAALAAANPRWHTCDAWWKATALERARRAAVEGFFRHNAGLDLRDRLGALTQPTLLLLGDPAYGGLWQAAAVAQVQALAPALHVSVIPHSSHNLHRDAWEPFAMALAHFLRTA
ncbi:alpha/beta fold hydrolase [Kallotenue papyrolyticum]|uniref:alpha/beta fold hydrolase n=1 Tax=Kallotenue papyrolyticum TaxID=1325125 RepID=UPI000492B2F1|nr:alpha/beta hydrolase [Kallotenue papyrolyticum]